MAAKKKKNKSKEERAQEEQLKNLIQVLDGRGYSVRRENLSRGSAFRVKSGNCSFQGNNLMFLDRRLPVDQQMSVVVDFLVEHGVEPSDEERQLLSAGTRELLSNRRLEA